MSAGRASQRSSDEAARQSLLEAFCSDTPLVVEVDGSLHSAVVALLIHDRGIWFIDDGWFDTMPSRPAAHFAEGNLSGLGPWHCGRHVFLSPLADGPGMKAWRMFQTLADGRLSEHRARAEARLNELSR